MRKIFLFVGIALAAAGLQGCVSSTLESEDFQSTASNAPIQNDPNAPTELVTASNEQASIANGDTVLDPVARRDAVIEMREKANNQSGEKTKFGLLPDTAGDQLTKDEQKALSNELEDTATQSQNTVSDAELAAKQESIRILRKKAQSHYKNAITTIEN